MFNHYAGLLEQPTRRKPSLTLVAAGMSEEENRTCLEIACWNALLLAFDLMNGSKTPLRR